MNDKPPTLLTNQVNTARIVRHGATVPEICMHNVKLGQGCFCPHCPVAIDQEFHNIDDVVEIRKLREKLSSWYRSEAQWNASVMQLLREIAISRDGHFEFTAKRILDGHRAIEAPKQDEPEEKPEIVGWIVGEPGGCPAMYNLSEREKAFDAAKRWERPITALVLDPRAPTLPTTPGDKAPMRTALEFIRDGLIPQGMSAKLFAERVLAQCSEKSSLKPLPEGPDPADDIPPLL